MTKTNHSSAFIPATSSGVFCRVSIKSFLTARGEIRPPTHNLIRLNSTATEYEKSLDAIYDFLEELNPYSAAIRYPGMSVTSEDAERAIEIMNNLRLRLKDLIDKVTNSK